MEPFDAQRSLEEAVATARAVADSLRAATSEAGLAQEKLAREKRTPKLADEPHRYTLLSTALTAGLTFVALLFSAAGWYNANRAIDVTVDGVKVAQRAYLVVKSGQVRAYQPIEQTAGLVRADSPMPLSVVFENLGNTPASNIGYCFEVVDPPGWFVQTSEPETPSKTRGPTCMSVVDVPQRGSVPSFALESRLMGNRDAWESLESVRKKTGVFELTLKGTAKYLDVFRDSHEITWCWRVSPNAQYPTPCDVDSLARRE